ncbi:DUF3090 family protein [Actinomarinicola tropica]|uniref:DUF3090 family protein n=1 Tax=Actinomarinicola tropica TaxID=2789776 RepID=UPI001896F87E|nr:DUF3090 family protein [Actinomarinicola tropica]
MNPSFDFHTPDHLTVGTVGPQGRRTFYLQVGGAGRVASFKLEKQQVAALADYLQTVLADLPEPDAPPLPAPELVEPVAPEWTIGGIGIAYDESNDRVLLLVHEVEVVDLDDEEDEDDELERALAAELGLDEPDGATARIQATRPQIAALVERARELVAAGRPLCPFCGLPDGPDGHMCPRAN